MIFEPINEDELLEVASKHAPTLAALWTHRGEVRSVHFEWDGGENYTQINRDPWGVIWEASNELKAREREKRLVDHVRGLEAAIIHGKAGIDTDRFSPISYVGGLLELGLDPEDAQILFLRGPAEIDWEDVWEDKHEFISEFTLAPRVREAITH